MKALYKVGVIGNPIGHSLSPKIHAQFADRANISLEYKAYEVSERQLGQFIQTFFSEGGHGLNITLPHKKKCISFVDIVSDEVRILGAANTLMLNDENQIVAESTDGKGFIDDCTEKKIQIENKNILIIGAGGASQSIIPSIAFKKPNKLMIDNRSKEKISPFVQKFAEFGLEQFNDLDLEIDLVINATSAGFSGPFQWDINRGLSQNTIFYDLSYGDASIEFLKWSKKFSNKTFDGAGMLVAQAAHSFNLWFNQLPSTKNINF